MASSLVTKLTCVFLLCMVAWAPIAHAITCGQVVSSLTPCIGYLTGAGPLPPACCSGIKSLNAAAKTTPDRQQACNCLQAANKNIKGINYGIAGGLPGKCGVNIPYKISPSTNCATIK